MPLLEGGEMYAQEGLESLGLENARCAEMPSSITWGVFT